MTGRRRVLLPPPPPLALAAAAGSPGRSAVPVFQSQQRQPEDDTSTHDMAGTTVTVRESRPRYPPLGCKTASLHPSGGYCSICELSCIHWTHG